MDVLHPILNRLVIPYFIGKDARKLEQHLFGVYRYPEQLQTAGMAVWCPVALVEFAILDMLGRISGQSIGEMLGGVKRTKIPFYVASGRAIDAGAGNRISARADRLRTGAKAVKYRLGGRMDKNKDSLPGGRKN